MHSAAAVSMTTLMKGRNRWHFLLQLVPGICQSSGRPRFILYVVTHYELCFLHSHPYSFAQSETSLHDELQYILNTGHHQGGERACCVTPDKSYDQEKEKKKGGDNKRDERIHMNIPAPHTFRTPFANELRNINMADAPLRWRRQFTSLLFFVLISLNSMVCHSLIANTQQRACMHSFPQIKNVPTKTLASVLGRMSNFRMTVKKSDEKAQLSQRCSCSTNKNKVSSREGIDARCDGC